MRGLILSAGLLTVLAASPSRAATTYAQKCEEVMGIPVPEVDCTDPAGSEVPVPGAEGGKCDNPSHGLSHCNPGTKFLKFVDTLTRDGKTETVITMMMCRKTDEDAGRAAEIYSDIGVIQYNEAKHATCWFSKTGPGQAPVAVPGATRRVYRSPSAPGNPAGWAHSDTCIACHQNGVWLRTPFAMGVVKEDGKGYERSSKDRPYAAGKGNEIPANNQKIAKRGLPCSVGLPDWNVPGAGVAPRMVKVNATAYDAKFPLAEGGPRTAPAGACTRCHYFGAGAGTQNCRTFLAEFKTGTNGLRKTTADFLSHYWMPPSNELAENRVATAAAYRATYGRPLDALAWCCVARNAADFPEICGAKFDGTDPGLFSGGACAQCSGCGSAP
jgi:hypothetical protein